MVQTGKFAEASTVASVGGRILARCLAKLYSLSKSSGESDEACVASSNVGGGLPHSPRSLETAFLFDAVPDGFQLRPSARLNVAAAANEPSDELEPLDCSKLDVALEVSGAGGASLVLPNGKVGESAIGKELTSRIVECEAPVA